eukprot:TRINITY_DN13268_c0_g1_i2.p1 TRINITY_DN13268_c0_g1~~TRINITY_DN13268_c0_g1_i2.p1  ORF type:complete len:600 (-),score=113.72 TRINITY_DN13268_c0_g1_i2:908-2707(-)
MMRQADELDERQKKERMSTKMSARPSKKRSMQLQKSQEGEGTSSQQSRESQEGTDVDVELKADEDCGSRDENEEASGERQLSQHAIELKKMNRRGYRWARKIGSSTFFKVLSVVGILLNVLFTGFFVDAKVKYEHGQLSSLLAYIIIESVFILWFFFEVTVRILNHRSRKIWRDPTLILDMVVILAPAIEVWILLPAGVPPVDVSISIMSICRIFRLIRGVMMLSRIPACKPLYLAIVGMWHSSGLLLANSVVVGTMLFTVSLGICLMIGPSRAVHAKLPQELAPRFASVSATFLTVTESLLRGVEWGPELVDPLMKNKDTACAGWVLLVFVIFGNSVVLNIIAGLFVHQIQSSGEISKVSNKFDDDVQVATAQMLDGLVKSFKEMDKDADGWLTLEEFLAGVYRHGETLAEIGIGKREAEQCFDTLDTDKSGCVSISEFLGGLQDTIVQKSLEVLIFEHQQKRLLKGLQDHSNRSRKDLNLVQVELATMNEWMEEAAEHMHELPQMVQERLVNQRTRVQSMTEQIAMDTQIITERARWQNSILTLSGSPSASPRLSSTPRSGPDPIMAAWQHTMKTRGVEAIRREISSSRNGTFGRSY